MSMNDGFSPSRFTEDIYSMIGIRPGIYWQATWRFVAPCVISVILVSSVVSEMISSSSYSAWNKELVRTSGRQNSAS